MVEFVIKYWLQVGFGLIISGFSIMYGRLHKKWKQEQKNQKTKEQQALEKKIEECIAPVIEHLVDIDNKIITLEQENMIVKEGLLSVQGSGFKRQCKILLDDNHIITELEWLQLQIDYEAYEKLGGNGEGHELYNAVVHKYYNMQ